MDISQPQDSGKPKLLYQFKEEGPLRRKELKLITFEIDSETDRGWWMRRPDRARLTWISRTADKRIAWPTIDEAYKDYKARKQVAINYHEDMISLQSQLLKQAQQLYGQSKEAAEV